MAIAQVQSAFHESAAATSNAVTVTATTAGNLLVVGLAFPHFTGTATSVTDNATGGSNTYTHATTAQINDGNNQSDIWYCENCKAGATTVTVNLPSAVVSVISVDEYSGVKTSGSFDLGTTTSSASGACVGPSQTPSATGELLYTVITTGARFLTGVSAPWTAGGHATVQQGDVWAYYINAPLSAQQAAAIPTTASAFVSSGASFLVAPSAVLFTGSASDVKSQWFANKGYVSNTLNDQISRYLAANGGGPSNDLNTQWYTFLSAKGRTGSTTDMYRAELIASLGLTSGSSLSITDLERMFYGSSANTFA